jgi:hypothetical protein
LFDDIVRDGNEKFWFGWIGVPPVPVQLPLRQLLHDVITRWDTVFYMVRRLREMRPVRQLHFCFDSTHTIQLSGCRSFPCSPAQQRFSKAPTN